MVSIAGSTISVLVLALVIDLTEASGFGEGLIIGLFAGVAFVATAMASNYIFESRSPKL